MIMILETKSSNRSRVRVFFFWLESAKFLLSHVVYFLLVSKAHNTEGFLLIQRFLLK